MLGCDNVVTLIHHIKNVDNDEYICKTFKNASWFKKLSASTSKEGANSSNTCECRIMTAEDISVACGDYIALGVIETYKSIKDLSEVDYFRITAIADNRRTNLKHWRFTG